jgi:glycosyltransferase involved in cell wall biosynthesis
VIPCLNEAPRVGAVVTALQPRLDRIIVVDDGSTDDTARVAQEAGAQVVRHTSRRGKGAALESGFRHALQAGCSWALTLDGDGQHAPADAGRFFRCAERTGTPLVAGDRMHDPAAIPRVRRWVNRWMSWSVSRLAGVPLRDSQCGYRLMRLAEWRALRLDAHHFVYESELLVAWCRAGHRVEFVPIEVIYGRGEVSHIAPLRDTLRWLRWRAAGHGLRRALANERGRP